MLEELLEGGWALNRTSNKRSASLRDIEVLAESARAADMSPVRPQIAKAIRILAEPASL